MNEEIIYTLEEGIRYLEAHVPAGDGFRLAISDSFTFGGKPDVMGAGVAVLLDQILGFGYLPDGFEQKCGFKVYAYKRI